MSQNTIHPPPFSSPPYPLLSRSPRPPNKRFLVLRGTIVNRTYGTHKNLYTNFYSQHLVLFTMVPRDSMQLAFRATRRTHHGASRLVQAMSAWSVKTRRRPSRHCRDAEAHGHACDYGHACQRAPPPLPSPPTSTLRPGVVGTRGSMGIHATSAMHDNE